MFCCCCCFSVRLSAEPLPHLVFVRASTTSWGVDSSIQRLGGALTCFLFSPSPVLAESQYKIS